MQIYAFYYGNDERWENLLENDDDYDDHIVEEEEIMKSIKSSSLIFLFR